MDGDSRNVEVGSGACNANCDFAAVGDQQLHRRFRSEVKVQ
jgi:hypothetical protein